MKFLFDKQHYRKNLVGSHYILLLPLIGYLQLALFNNECDFYERFMSYIFINNALVLIAYRCDVNPHLFTFCNSTLALFVYKFQLYFSHRKLINYFVLTLFVNTFSLFLLRHVPVKYKKCFSFGEFSIIFQCFMYYLLEILKYVLTRFGWMKFAISTNESNLFCLICFTSLLTFFVLTSLVRKASTYSSLILGYSSVIPILSYLLLFPLFLYYTLYNTLSEEPVAWLFHYFLVDKTRANLFTLWLTILSVTCTFVYIHTYISNQSTTTITRKFFHFAILAVYLFGIKYDAQFLQFTSKIALLVFIFIEIIRLSDIPLFSAILNQIFTRFRDDKDTGILTLTHIYLLVGCSSSLWITCNQHFNNKLLLCSGIISIGVGDTFASLGGYYFGKHKWPSSSKTYEGTFCSLLSQVIAYCFLNYYFHDRSLLLGMSLVKLSKICTISLMSSLVETFTSHVDNLILPLIHYIFMLIVF